MPNTQVPSEQVTSPQEAQNGLPNTPDKPQNDLPDKPPPGPAGLQSRSGAPSGK
ncbi:hypothetical protein [Corallococcus sicarius]|uniref:hypothetical protein n=1 Tax=Corallococcus sicarius TaxID=2316726 RepID=UPI001315A89D|nr:hypothetical protein [Corallococcus sicarius]